MKDSNDFLSFNYKSMLEWNFLMYYVFYVFMVSRFRSFDTEDYIQMGCSILLRMISLYFFIRYMIKKDVSYDFNIHYYYTLSFFVLYGIYMFVDVR